MLNPFNKNNPHIVKLRLNGDAHKSAPNVTGVLGKICNNCGGYGYTMSIRGTKIDCNDCEQTGVGNPTNREIQIQLSDLKKDLQDLKGALIKTLVGKGEELDADEVRRNIRG